MIYLIYLIGLAIVAGLIFLAARRYNKSFNEKTGEPIERPAGGFKMGDWDMDGRVGDPDI